MQGLLVTHTHSHTLTKRKKEGEQVQASDMEISLLSDLNSWIKLETIGLQIPDSRKELEVF